jgi:hypothetical protein
MGAIRTFANILPVLTGTAGALQDMVTTLDTTASAARDLEKVKQKEQKLAMAQLQKQQRLEENNLAQQNDLERQQMDLQATQEDESRQQALRRAVARQKAQFGSQGVGANNGGSGQAVLLGFFDETEDERAKREQIDAVRSSALDLNMSQKRGLNLLQATQLAQRQKLTGYSDF